MTDRGPPPPGCGVPIVVDLPDGRRLTVREMAEDDVDAIVALYGTLSNDDRYRRFFSGSRAPRSFVRLWVHRACTRGFGLVAVIDEGLPGSLLVAEAAYVLLPNGDGELAITVAHDWRGWLGPYLLELLVEEAGARGVPNLEADILTENRTMRSMVRHRGQVMLGDNDDVSVVRVAIGAGQARPVWPASPGKRRLLVEVPGGRWSHAGAAARAGFEVLACDRISAPAPRAPSSRGRAGLASGA